MHLEVECLLLFALLVLEESVMVVPITELIVVVSAQSFRVGSKLCSQQVQNIHQTVVRLFASEIDVFVLEVQCVVEIPLPPAYSDSYRPVAQLEPHQLGWHLLLAP